MDQKLRLWAADWKVENSNQVTAKLPWLGTLARTLTLKCSVTAYPVSSVR